MDFFDDFLNLPIESLFTLDETKPFFGLFDLAFPLVRTRHVGDYLDAACESLLIQDLRYSFRIFSSSSRCEYLKVLFQNESTRFSHPELFWV
jgi:hypothetical protein